MLGIAAPAGTGFTPEGNDLGTEDAYPLETPRTALLTGDGEDARIDRALRGRSEREIERWEEQVPGTIFSAVLDSAHPLAFGAGVDGHADRLFVLHTESAAVEPDEAFETVAHFPAGLQKVSGAISERNLALFSRATWVAVRPIGRGRVILFAADPVFRHFWYVAFQPYANALLIGPAL